MTPRTAGISALSGAAEDFLKAVYLLRQGDDSVTTSALTGYLQLSDAAVTKMSRRLDELGLVSHTPYHGVVLTEAGVRVALEIVRNHRLLELFLAELLDYDWAGVHSEADRLEHVVSADFVERVDRVLGHPQLDPHGDPIPTPSGELREQKLDALSGLAVGQRATVRRVLAQQPEALQYLAGLGLVPGAAVEVVEVAPMGGPVTVRVGEKAQALARDLAEAILVSTEAPTQPDASSEQRQMEGGAR